MSICPPAPSEVLALAALRARLPLFTRAKSLVDDGWRAVIAFALRHRGHLFDEAAPLGEERPMGGTVCFPRLRRGLNAAAYAERLAAEAGVMVVPGDAFEGHVGRFGRRVRLGLGRRSTEAALAAWEAHIVGGGCDGETSAKHRVARN